MFLHTQSYLMTLVVIFPRWLTMRNKWYEGVYNNDTIMMSLMRGFTLPAQTMKKQVRGNSFKFRRKPLHLTVLSSPAISWRRYPTHWTSTINCYKLIWNTSHELTIFIFCKCEWIRTNIFLLMKLWIIVGCYGMALMLPWWQPSWRVGFI